MLAPSLTVITACTSCCLGQCPNQWKRANFDPHSSETAWSILMKLELSPEDHPPCKISFWSDDVGGLGKYPACQCYVSFFKFLSFFSFFRSLCHVHSSHWWTDLHDLYVILTSLCLRMCPSLICLPFRGQVPPKNPFWGREWIGVLKPHSQNIKTCILSKLLYRFQPKFCTVIKTTKCPLWIIQICTLQNHSHHLGKIKK